MMSNYSGRERELEELLRQCRNQSSGQRRLLLQVQWTTFIQFYKYVVAWLIPSMLTVGVLGSGLCLLVLVRRRNCMGSNVMRIWLICLTVCDLYSLVFGLLIMYLARLDLIFMSTTGSENDEGANLVSLASSRNVSSGLQKTSSFVSRNYKHSTRTGCYLLNGVVYFGLLVSAWVQSGMSLVRALSLGFYGCKLHKSRSMGRQYGWILVTVLLPLAATALLMSLCLEYERPRLCPVLKVCRLKAAYHLLFFNTSIVIKVMLPSVVLLFSSAVIIHNIHKYQLSISMRLRMIPSYRYVLLKRMKHRRISCVLLAMNLSFFLLSMPFEMFKIYLHNSPPIKDGVPQSNYGSIVLLRTIDQSLNILLYLNNALNWLFYCFLGQRFRQCLSDQLNLSHNIEQLRRFVHIRASFWPSKKTTAATRTFGTSRPCPQCQTRKTPISRSSCVKRFKVLGGGSLDLQLAMRNGNVIVNDQNLARLVEMYRLEPMSDIN